MIEFPNNIKIQKIDSDNEFIPFALDGGQWYYLFDAISARPLKFNKIEPTSEVGVVRMIPYIIQDTDHALIVFFYFMYYVFNVCKSELPGDVNEIRVYYRPELDKNKVWIGLACRTSKK